MVNTSLRDSQSELTCIRVGGEWICILCDVKLYSRDQMAIHEEGERHAYSLAHLKARESDYLEYCFWRALKPYIPDYPSLFPGPQRLSRTPPLEDNITSSPVIPPFHASDPPQLRDGSFSRSPSSLSSLDSDDPILPSFFQENYKRIVPRGAFYCEPCRAVCVSRREYEQHLDSESHTAVISKFSNVEVDYFQPVYVGTKLLFVGLVTRRGFIYDNFFEMNQSVLTLQWRVADRVPNANSRIMKLSGDDFTSLFNVT